MTSMTNRRTIVAHGRMAKRELRLDAARHRRSSMRTSRRDGGHRRCHRAGPRRHAAGGHRLKSDVQPTPETIDHYRAQVRAYLDMTGAARGLIVLVTTGEIYRWRHRRLRRSRPVAGDRGDRC